MCTRLGILRSSHILGTAGQIFWSEQVFRQHCTKLQANLPSHGKSADYPCPTLSHESDLAPMYIETVTDNASRCITDYEENSSTQICYSTDHAKVLTNVSVILYITINNRGQNVQNRIFRTAINTPKKEK